MECKGERVGLGWFYAKRGEERGRTVSGIKRSNGNGARSFINGFF